jgi:hypothetical protein
MSLFVLYVLFVPFVALFVASEESEAHGRRNLLVYSGGFQTSRFGIDREHDDIIRTLISDQQEPPRWINREIAWPVAFSGGVLHEREFARSLVDLEDDNAVVSAIRAIEKSAR